MDFKVTFREYYQFYNDNKNKIHMTEKDGVGQHPVNEEAVKAWIGRISRLKDENERNFYLFFANAFAWILSKAYITYPVFQEAVNAVAAEIYEKIVSNSYDKIVFILNGELEKSNTWISLLMMDYFDKQDKFFDVSDKIDIVCFDTKTFEGSDYVRDLDTEKKYLFLHFDDMSYSGGQAAQAVNNLWAYSNQKLTDENISYFIAIPYITERAKNYMSEYNKGIKFLNSTITFPSFFTQLDSYYATLSPEEQSRTAPYLQKSKQMCAEKYFKQSNQPRGSPFATDMPANIKKGIWAFRCVEFKTLVYFDHKLADDVSSFQKILYFGSYPINSNGRNATTRKRMPICEQESLIKGCKIPESVKSEMSSKNINACRNYIQLSGSKPHNLPQSVVCPPTFYKNIQYVVAQYEEKKYKGEPGVMMPYKMDKTRSLADNIDQLNNILSREIYSYYDDRKNLQEEVKKIMNTKKLNENSAKDEVFELIKDRAFNALEGKKRRLETNNLLRRTPRKEYPTLPASPSPPQPQGWGNWLYSYLPSNPFAVNVVGNSLKNAELLGGGKKKTRKMRRGGRK